MKKISVIMLAIAIVPCAAIAQDQNSYLCSNGELQRRVEVVYETGVSVPCEVHYYKDTEAPGARQVLWRATNQEGYCEQQTRAFIAQLTNWGWDCDLNIGETGNPAEDQAAAASEPEAAADD